jgi:hypothetical protein
VIVEGILVLHVPELRDQLNMKVYVDTGGFEEGARTEAMVHWLPGGEASGVLYLVVGGSFGYHHPLCQ